MITNFVPPYNIKSDYGFLHVYALTMTLGIIVAILACYIKANKYKLPTETLILSTLFIIPASLFLASFFGKVVFKDFHWNQLGFYFSFWNSSGGMSIHGGVLGGVIAALAFFIYPARKYKISMWVWVDCIVPNILIGQAIGRWGNFFNHELLGEQVSYESLKWLPTFIRDNCWQWTDPAAQTHPEGWAGGTFPGGIVFRQPIFLYESFLDFMAWMIITFIIPNIGKWFGPKPWKKFPKKYKTSFRYSFKKTFNRKLNSKELKSYKEIWNEVYYNKELPKEKIKPLQHGKGFSRKLQSLHNPNRYLIVKCGAQGGAYFFLWNFIRFILERYRTDADLFIPYLRGLDYTLILLTAFIGIIMIIISQCISPYYQRKVDWLYEKQF